MKIFIDPGHGGAQPGAVNTASGRMEKDACLRIGLKLAEILECSGCTVYMSRTGDVHISLTDRCTMANRARADAFVSIHLNSARPPDGLVASGLETWLYSGASYRTQTLATYVNASLAKALPIRNRGVKKTSAFTVCKQTFMPAIVVECGFISNDAECEILFDDSTQTHIAQAIASGLRAWGEYQNVW